MTDSIISRLNAALDGRYFIEQQLGEGGMATVYLARDLKHDRDVALKVLKPELAAVVGGDRFLSEIRTTANLQHPHILPLFDSGEADGFLYFVMPLVEGESLRARLDREGELPVDEAVRIAVDLCGALDHAHRRGVIHRDIKPGNILFQEGRPLLTDFGIALAVGAGASSRLTETGLSVGTPYYMSPEQAAGDRAIGPASDVYAMACVLYECLAGEPPHQGSSAQAVLARILAGEVKPVREHRPRTPVHVNDALAQALERLSADRFSSAGDFAAALQSPAFRYGDDRDRAGGAQGGVAAGWRPAAAALAVVSVLLAALLISGGGGQESSSGGVRRLAVPIPDGEAIAMEGVGRLAVSADGRRIAYLGTESDGLPEIWVRDLSSPAGQPIRGTKAACCIALSPDGERVAYVDRNVAGLKTVGVDGTDARSLHDESIPESVAWGEDGWIYFSVEEGIMRVREDSGAAEWVTRLDRSKSEFFHRSPHPIAGSSWVLFSMWFGDTTGATVFAVDTESGEVRRLRAGDNPIYSPSTGHLLFTGTGDQESVLFAVELDLGSMEIRGTPRQVLNDLAVNAGRPDVELTDDGTLMYRAGYSAMAGLEELVWVDRAGNYAPATEGWQRDFQSVALSPDGSRVAASIRPTVQTDGRAPTGPNDLTLWVRDLDTGIDRRLTLDEAMNTRARWHPDGERIIYISNLLQDGDTPEDPGRNELLIRDVSGGDYEVLVDLERDIWEGEFSPSGEWLVYRIGTPPTRDLFVTHLHPDSVARTISASDEAEEVMPAISPDGRWLAYQSSETGTYEVYVRPFPNIEDGKIPVSSGGGMSPRWNPRGGELFYKSLEGTLISARIRSGDTFELLGRDSLFATLGYQQGDAFCCHPMYDVAPDGERFLMVRHLGGVGYFAVIQNFQELLSP